MPADALLASYGEWTSGTSATKRAPSGGDVGAQVRHCGLILADRCLALDRHRHRIFDLEPEPPCAAAPA